MIVKLLTEHQLEFLSLKGSGTGSLVKMSNCWKSHAAAQIIIRNYLIFQLISIMSGADFWFNMCLF